MNWLRLSIVLLQVLTALSKKCTSITGELGLCESMEDCESSGDMTLPYSKCGETGLYCCRKRKNPVHSRPEIDSKFPEQCGKTHKYPVANIIGGIDIEPDEYSWLASLQYGNKTRYGSCGASVINSFYILTAAHCVQSPTVDRLGGLTGVRLGDFEHERKCDYGSNGCKFYQQFEVEQIIVHENFTHNPINIDIALIRVKNRIPLGPNVQPICLPIAGTVEPSLGDIVTISGWGIPHSGHKRAVSNPLVHNDNCSLDSPLISQKICADKAQSGSCLGDSGGPLMHEFKDSHMMIEGIASYGWGCRHKTMPSVYTRVRSFMDWIEKHIDMRPTH